MSKPKKPDLNTRASQNDIVDRYTRQLKVVQQISQLIGSTEQSEKILQAASHHLLHTLGYDAVQIFRLSPSGKDLWLFLEYGTGNKPVTQNTDIFSVDEQNIVGQAIRDKKPVYIPDIHQGPYSYYGQTEADSQINSELAIPLKSGQSDLGVLRIQCRELNGFTQDDITFLTSLSNLLGITIKNAQTMQQLQDNLDEIDILDNLRDKDNQSQQALSNKGKSQSSYQYDHIDITAARDDELPPSAKLAIAQKQEGVVASQSEHNRELIAPIKLYGETIGVLGIEDESDGEDWTVDDINLLEEVSSQVALAIENARLLQQTQERTHELSILFETSRQLSETINPAHIYEIAANQVVNYLNADLCSVSLINKARTHFEEIVIKQRNSSRQGGQVPWSTSTEPKLIAIEDSPALQHMLKQPNLIIEHLDIDPPSTQDEQTYQTDNGDSPPHQLATVKDNKAVTLIRFPLLVRYNLVGILQATHLSEYREYTQNELQLAKAIISQATVAIENAQLFAQTESALTETQKLYEISRSLVESNSLDETFEIILGSVRAYNIDRVSISLLEQDKTGNIDKVVIAASWDRDSDKKLPVGSEVSADEFSLVKAFAQPPFQPLVSNDLSQAEGQDDRMDDAFRLFMYEQLGVVTLFSAPLFLGTEYKGVLSISTRTPHIYSRQESRIYQTLADQAIISIERQRLLEATRSERDRAALLYDFGQRLSQTTTIEEVKKAVLSFTPQVGATQGEIYITDGKDLYSMASTISERQNLSSTETEQLARIVLSQGLEARALKSRTTVFKTRRDVDWNIDGVPSTDMIEALISTPFYSQRSNLQGTLTFSHPQERVFSQDHLQMFESMAIQTVAALENAWLLLQTATSLSDTELLYRATRDFNSCQHVEDLLAILAESFVSLERQTESRTTLPNINHMSIGLITALEEDGAPKSLDLVADWNRQPIEADNQFTVTTPNIKITSNQYPFIKQLSSNIIHQIRKDQPGAEGYMEEYLGKAGSALSVPLRVGTNWLGILYIASCANEFRLKPNTINQITALAGQIAVVIQNLQLVEETQQNLYNSEILSRLSQELLTADTPEAIYNLSLDAIAATDPSRGAAIFAYDKTERGIELALVAIWNNPSQPWPAILPGARFSTIDLGLEPLLKTGQTVTSSSVTEDIDFSETLRQLLNLMQIQSLVAVPIWLNKEVNGFILIGHKTYSTFPADTIWLYENIGRLSSGALENHRLFEEAQYRATQLQTAAEVSQVATSHLDLDPLLTQSVNLIRDRFGFYHVSIFLVDEHQKFAVVEASTGEVGQQMLEMKHKLAVGGRSIVGTATGTAKPRIALDVGQDAVHFNNPLLPKTRSEMALPLIARGQVIGALDVQSTQPNAFTTSDITILQSMANQLANAIEAARSFQQANKALEDMGRIQERYLREEWSAFLKEQRAGVGYRLSKDGFIAIDESTPTSEEHQLIIKQALEAKRPLIVPNRSLNNCEDHRDEDATDSPSLDGIPGSKNTSTLIAPLALPEQVAIGAVDFETFADEIEDEDTLGIIEAVTTQAAQAIEAIRLFEQTQAAREEAETLYKAGRALVAAESEEEMFHTVLREMLSTLGLDQGGILFFEPNRKFGKLVALFKDGQPVVPDLRIPIKGNPSYARLISTKQPVAIVDFAADPLVAPVRATNPEHRIASLLLVPIIINDEVIGSIGADAVEKKHYYTDQEINLVRAIADQLSIALQNRRLLEETRRRAVELQETAERLQEMDKLKTQFLANMSHELRTPLNSIIGFSRVILKGIDGPLTELQKTDLTSIYNSGQHLLGLINNVLDLSKIEAGKMELNFEEVEIGPVIKGVMSTTLALVKDKPVELIQEVPDNLPAVWADSTRLRQIILNLVSNACKFTEEGNVTVRATAKKEKIIISVSDTGMGIPSENMENIFEEFTQVDASTTRKVGGTGLGLPISRHFVEMHKGQIWVDSTPGRGSSFSFAIPINPTIDVSETTSDEIVTNGKEGQGKTIVAIDDDLGVINLYKRFLEKRNYNIIAINNTQDVVTQIKEHSPSAVLLDILMPDKDGWHVLKELKQDALTKDIPVIICSIISDKNKGFDLGASDYLTKPIVESELVNALKHIDELQKEQIKVLVIDDQADDILLIRRMLEAHNYKIIEASNGKEGLDLAQSRTPDLIILDLSMPEMDGFAVVEALKIMGETRNIPVIIVSAKEPTQAEYELLTGQVEVLLHKSIFTENELVDVVSQALKRVDAYPEPW